MVKKEKQVSSKNVFKGKLLDVYLDEVKCQDGTISTREIIRHCKASCVLAFTSDNKIVMERQYRYPYDEVIYELPAGKCDSNEDPKVTALRELEEETGYKASKIKYLGKIYPSCAYTDEIIYCYQAEELTITKTHLDEGEFLEVELLTLDEVLKLIKEDKINDAKTIATIAYYLISIKQES